MATTKTNKGDNKMNVIVKEYSIHTPRIEATQRGYIVTVNCNGKRVDISNHHDDGTSKGIDKAYSNACSVVESVKRGKLTFSRKGFSCNLNGRKLTCTRHTF
jgi:hypothetical protein